MKAAILKYEDVNTGDIFSFERAIGREDIITFSNLTGDFSPLHTDEEFGKKSRFKKNIVQGMLASSFFSTIIGMHCPGKYAIYISQSLNFRKPVYPGDKILIKGEIIRKIDSLKIIEMYMSISRNGEILIDGKAKAGFMEVAK